MLKQLNIQLYKQITKYFKNQFRRQNAQNLKVSTTCHKSNWDTNILNTWRFTIDKLINFCILRAQHLRLKTKNNSYWNEVRVAKNIDLLFRVSSRVCGFINYYWFSQVYLICYNVISWKLFEYTLNEFRYMYLKFIFIWCVFFICFCYRDI